MKWDKFAKILFATVGIMATGVGILYLALAIVLIATFLLGKVGGWA